MHDRPLNPPRGRKDARIGVALCGGAATIAVMTVLLAAHAVPRDMRAVRLHGAGGPEVLKLDRVPLPSPGADQVLIRVHAASVNPVDWKWRESLSAIDRLRVPGRDASGVIAALGPGVDKWKVGDAIIARLGKPYGAYAEYTIASTDNIAEKPGRLSFAQAAGIPTAGVTAWRYLVDAGHVAHGERVLIHGGAGGVGSAAVQIAKAHGAHVIATASARNHEYLLSIGADLVIDYNTTRFEDVVREVDIVFDTVGGDTLDRSIPVLAHGGRLLSAAGRAAPGACARAGLVCFDADYPAPASSAALLKQICDLAEAGQFTVNIDRIFRLESAGAAQEFNRAGHTRGKVVIQIIPDEGD